MKRAVAALAVILSTSAVACSPASSKLADRGSHDTTSATVAYPVDGDTLRIELNHHLEYLRLVGIDTPEDVRPGTPVECGSRQAASSMSHLAPPGARLTIRFDSVADRRDRYKRLLGHAFVGGRQLEIAQLRRGWADVYRFEGQRFDGLARFERAEEGARDADVGVWRTCDGDFHSAS